VSNKLIAGYIDALIGPSTMPNAFAILDIIAEAKVPLGSMLVIDDIAETDPIDKVAQSYITAYEKQFGQKPATLGANTYDAGIILRRAISPALKVAKPGTETFRTALRDAIEQERDVVGCPGVFNMSPTNHHGMDERARVPVTVKGGRFRLLPE
jgi:branched-chain amino acid transport system substrate-binding protein